MFNKKMHYVVVEDAKLKDALMILNDYDVPLRKVRKVSDESFGNQWCLYLQISDKNMEVIMEQINLTNMMHWVI